MKKGDVETYIKKFETLRRSIGWPEDRNGTITQFQRRLGATHTCKVHEGTIPCLITLRDWYAAAQNQWKGTKSKEICEEVKNNAHTIIPVTPTPIVICTTEVKSEISGLEAACWRQVLAGRQTTAEGKR